MSNEYPPPPPGQDPNQPPSAPPPPTDPQWNPQSPGTPPPPAGSGQYGQPYGQPQYGQPPSYPPPPPGAPGGYQQPQQTSPLAITSLVLGIVGLLCCTIFILSAGAVVTGFLARKQIAESQGRIKGGGMATAGLVLGGVGILLAIVYWVLFVTGVFTNNFYFDTTT